MASHFEHFDDSSSYSSSDSESVFSYTSSSYSSSTSTTNSSVIYVGHLPPFVTEGHLRQHFSSSGEISQVHVIRDKETKISKGFAFIHFTSDETAERAVITHNKSLLLNKHVIIVKRKRKESKNKHDGEKKKDSSRRGRRGRGERMHSKDTEKISEERPQSVNQAISPSRGGERGGRGRGGGRRHSSEDTDKPKERPQSVSSFRPRNEKENSKSSKDLVKVWVGNLSSSTTKDDLIIHFGAFKNQMVRPIQNIGKGKNDTFFTFLSFSCLKDANDVVQRMNQTSLKGKKLRIQLSRTKELSPPATFTLPVLPALPLVTPLATPTSVPLVTSKPPVGRGRGQIELAKETKPLTEVKGHGLLATPTTGNGRGLIASPPPTGNGCGLVQSRRPKRGHGLKSPQGVVQVTLTNIPPLINEEELKDLLAPHNPIDIKVDSSTKKAQVTFNDHLTANAAVKEWNGQTLLGNSINAYISRKEESYPLSSSEVTELKITHSENISQELYDLCCSNSSLEIESFKSKGGIITFTGGVLKLQAKSQEDISPVLKIFKSYTERIMDCSPDQWNQLVLVNEFGVSKLKELKGPFDSHPQLLIQERAPLKLAFVGSIDAVDSAYYHFYNDLNKELLVDSTKLELLVELMPDLDEHIAKKYSVRVNGFTLGSTHLTFTGNSANISLARKEIESALINIKQSVLPNLPEALIRAGIKIMKNKGAAVIIIEKESKKILVSNSRNFEQDIKIFNRKPYTNTIDIDDSHFNSDSFTVTTFEDYISSDCVHVILDSDKNVILLEGYDKDEVQLARKEILSAITSSVKQEKLVCSSEQRAYLKKLFKSSPDVKARFPNVILRRDDLFIQGTQEERTRWTKDLLAFVPSNYTTVSIICDRRSFPLIDQYLLTPYNVESILLPDRRGGRRGGEGGGGKGGGEEKGKGGGSNELKIMLFSGRSLEEYCVILMNLSPGTFRVPVNPQAKEIVEKIKTDIETQCHCKIVILNRPYALIHYLKLAQGQKAKQLITNNINKQLIVFRHLPSPPISALHLKFLIEMYKEHFEECSKGLTLFQLPKIKMFDAIQEDEMETIKVKGTINQVESVKEVLDELIGEKAFHCERFTLHVTFHYFLIHMWQKRFKQLKSVYKSEEDIMFEFKTLHSGEERPKSITGFEFCVFGFNEFAFRKLKSQLSQELTRPLWEQDIPASPVRIKEVHVALQERKLDFKDYSVDVYCNEKAGKVVIRAPQSSPEDIQFVYDEIQSFLEHTSVISVEVILPDLPTYLMLISKQEPYFKEILKVAKSLQVTLRPYRRNDELVLVLKGLKTNIDSLQPILDTKLALIGALIDHVSVPVDPLALPCLTSAFCREVNAKLESLYMTVMSVNTSSLSSASLPSPSLPSSQSDQWFWQDDTGSYIHYDSNTCKQLSDSYGSDPVGYHIIISPGEAIEVNFALMVQLNLQTGEERKIRHIPSTTNSTGVTSSSVQWYWTSDDGTKLMPYTLEQSRSIEDMYSQQKNLFRIKINSHSYVIDLHRMIQISDATGRKRSIKRKANNNNNNDNKTVVLYGPKINLHAASQFLQSKLSNSLKTNEMAHPLLSNQQFYKEVQQIASKHNVTINPAPPPSSPSSPSPVAKGGGGLFGSLFFKGVNYCINKVMQEVQERISESQAPPTGGAEDMEVPPEWEPQDSNLKLAQVTVHSREYKKVERLFTSTLSSCRIVSITRIQNLWLYERYIQHMKRLESKNKGLTNERELFHGTRNTKPSEIYDSEEGFDMRFSASGMWGQANYFAVNASYSHCYAHLNANGQREMFLVRVLTGDSYRSQPDSSLRMPPKKLTNKGSDNMRYDTVNGTTKGSDVFMAYDNQKAYPAYIITYY